MTDAEVWKAVVSGVRQVGLRRPWRESISWVMSSRGSEASSGGVRTRFIGQRHKPSSRPKPYNKVPTLVPC